MRQPRAAETFRLLKGDHQARVRAARRRTHALLHKGDATAALVAVHEALRNLPGDGQLPPDVHADLRTQLLADRSVALGALAEEIYHGPQPPAGRRARAQGAGRRGGRTGLTGPVITLGCCALAAVGLATAARWAGAHLDGAWHTLAPVAIAFGAVATLVATVGLLAAPADPNR